jgi:hypothetical protein
MNETVTVACRLPKGLVLQLSKDGRRVKGEHYRIWGTRDRHDGCRLALTRNIPRSFWEQWLTQNEANPIVVNKLIFAY